MERASEEVGVFRNADEAYLKWIGDHKGGWVVNANKEPEARLLAAT
jgi:hypothetical protein